MPTLLHLDASPRGKYSISRQLSAFAVNAWKKHPTGKVIERDLSQTNLTFVDMEWIAGAFSAPDQHTEEIGTPMYNFAIPAVLKAWIDHPRTGLGRGIAAKRATPTYITLRS